MTLKTIYHGIAALAVAGTLSGCTDYHTYKKLKGIEPKEASNIEQLLEGEECLFARKISTKKGTYVIKGPYNAAEVEEIKRNVQALGKGTASYSAAVPGQEKGQDHPTGRRTTGPSPQQAAVPAVKQGTIYFKVADDSFVGGKFYEAGKPKTAQPFEAGKDYSVNPATYEIRADGKTKQECIDPPAFLTHTKSKCEDKVIFPERSCKATVVQGKKTTVTIESKSCK